MLPAMTLMCKMAEVKKHSSYKEPSDKPFFSLISQICTHSTLSPRKWINMRGQCADQLLKFHELFEKGVIPKEQFTVTSKNFDLSIVIAMYVVVGMSDPWPTILGLEKQQQFQHNQMLLQ